jgi:hypothetical protein
MNLESSIFSILMLKMLLRKLLDHVMKMFPIEIADFY